MISLATAENEIGPMTRYMDLHDEWMQNPDYARAYDALEDDFSIVEALVDARLKAGLTRTDLALRMQTTQSVIARLESGALPSTRTLKRFAAATGTKLRITFEPDTAQSGSASRTAS